MIYLEQEVPVTQYSFTVNTNNIINNVNVGTTKLELVEAAAEAKTNLKLVVYDENGAKPVTYTNVSLAKDSKDINLGTDVTPTGKSFSDVLDGTLSFELYEIDENGKDVLVGKTSVVKNTVAPELVQVSAVRGVTKEATYKGTRFGESDIKTVYYCAVPMDKSGTPTWTTATKTFSVVNGYTPATKKIDMTGKDSFEHEITGLEMDTAYKVYYVLENSYGSLSNTSSIPSINLSKAIALEKEEKVDVKTITFTKTDKKFTWSESATGATKNFIVTVYKDGKLLKEDTNVFNNEFDLTNYATEAETYYIEVVRKGKIQGQPTDKLDSDAVKSKTVTVKDINKVSNVKLGVNTDNGYPELSWTENDKNCGGYKLELYKQDAVTGVFETTATLIYTSSSGADKKSVYFTTASINADTSWNASGRLGRNTNYRVEIVANAKGDIENNDDWTIYVDSKPETYLMYAPYRDAKVESATDSSVTLTLDEITRASGIIYHSATIGYKKPAYTYAVRVYEGTTDMGTRDVTVTYDYDEDDPEKITATHFTVNGLKANTDYTFRLIAKCDGFEGWSEEIKNVHTMPRIENLICATEDDAKVENSKKFYADASLGSEKLIIANDTPYQASDYTNAELKAEFVALVNFLATLKEEDTVTIKGNKVDLALSATENADEMNLGSDYLKDKVVTIDGTGHERVLAGGVISELHLKNGLFKIDDVDLTSGRESEEKGKIVLESGVAVEVAKTNSDLTVVAGTVTINNVKMTTQLETTVRTLTEVNTRVLIVVANGEKTNNLTFENMYDNADADKNKNATIRFVSNTENATVQQGTITIKGEGGVVKVEQENVSVGSSINVTVEKGEVDVSESTLTGSKTVTLKGNEEESSITAVAANVAPEILKGKEVEIKAYANAEELKEELGDNISAGYKVTDSVVEEVNTWLSKFGINGKEAKVTVDSTSTKVTITYSGSETLTVQGLK